MLFSSIPFLYYFLPAALLLYAAVPAGMKNAALLLASLIFYAWGEPRLVLLMLLTVFCGYICGILTERYPRRKKLFMALVLMTCLGMLGYFKYADFFIANFNAVTGLSLPLLRVALPVGISFYTFQILSYNIDVYRGSVAAQRNFIDLAAYIAFFPQLIAGPIVRYSHIAAQLRQRTHSIDKTAEGMRRFILGLAKKILLANPLGELCDIYQGTVDNSVLFCWLYGVAFMLQIYFDFSGYSDMAIGLGRICGFDLPENFNYPYTANSITDFWRRWHITLGAWFRDYVYIPLGGSRCSRLRTLGNILLVWMLTGFWHGAAWNFILWGLYFAVLLLAEKLWLLPYLPRAGVWGRVYVLLAVMFGFILFNAGSVGEALDCLSGLFGAGGLPVVSAEAVYYLRSYGVILLLAVIGATPLPAKTAARLPLVQYLEPGLLVGLLVVATAYLVDGSFDPFLYFRF